VITAKDFTIKFEQAYTIQGVVRQSSVLSTEKYVGDRSNSFGHRLIGNLHFWDGHSYTGHRQADNKTLFLGKRGLI